MKSKFNLKKFTNDIADQLASHPENEKFTFQSGNFKLTIYHAHPDQPARLRTYEN